MSQRKPYGHGEVNPFADEEAALGEMLSAYSAHAVNWDGHHAALAEEDDSLTRPWKMAKVRPAEDRAEQHSGTCMCLSCM